LTNILTLQCTDMRPKRQKRQVRTYHVSTERPSCEINNKAYFGQELGQDGERRRKLKRFRFCLPTQMSSHVQFIIGFDSGNTGRNFPIITAAYYMY
jgi:hypothetical protein